MEVAPDLTITQWVQQSDYPVGCDVTAEQEAAWRDRWASKGERNTAT
jgi:hypothetical protein